MGDGPFAVSLILQLLVLRSVSILELEVTKTTFESSRASQRVPLDSVTLPDVPKVFLHVSGRSVAGVVRKNAISSHLNDGNLINTHTTSHQILQAIHWIAIRIDGFSKLRQPSRALACTCGLGITSYRFQSVFICLSSLCYDDHSPKQKITGSTEAKP